MEVMPSALQWRALFETSLPGWQLWHSDSHESPFVPTLMRNMMWRDTVCMCEASIVQHWRLFLSPVGRPGGQHRWEAGLFCSYDVMANKAPPWNPLQVHNYIRCRWCHWSAPAPGYFKASEAGTEGTWFLFRVSSEPASPSTPLWQSALCFT